MRLGIDDQNLQVAHLDTRPDSDYGQGMRISLVVTVEVDREDWERSYGAQPGALLRQDVKSYVTSLLSGSVAVEDGTVRRIEVR